MRAPRQYLTGYEARDVALVTNLCLSSTTDRVWDKPKIHPLGVSAMDEGVFLDLTRLGWWDQWRVAWVRIGMHQYVRQASMGESSRRSSATSQSITRMGCALTCALSNASRYGC